MSPNVVTVPNVHCYMLTNEVNHFGKYKGDRVGTLWFVHSCGMQIATVTLQYGHGDTVHRMKLESTHQYREECSGMISIPILA
jgi:hypothetical protein